MFVVCKMCDSGKRQPNKFNGHTDRNKKYSTCKKDRLVYFSTLTHQINVYPPFLCLLALVSSDKLSKTHLIFTITIFGTITMAYVCFNSPLVVFISLSIELNWVARTVDGLQSVEETKNKKNTNWEQCEK